MASSLTWVDFSDEDRQRMAAVVQLFQDSETVDELGIGIVRDVFANRLFPGTSTIQTRARYFLFVPWIYRHHEKRRTSAAEIAQRARADEIRLIEALVENDDAAGVIGALKREALKGLPSAIYWAGLGKLGIRRFVGSPDEYHRTFGTRTVSIEVPDDEDETTSVDAFAWDPQLPPIPDDFPKKASLALSEHEADYLAGKIQAIQPRSLFALLVSRMGPSANVDLPWLHPDVVDLDENHREELEHARNLSEVFHGAALLYNLMLAEAAKNEQYTADYNTELDTWAAEMDERGAAHRGWNLQSFWTIANTGRIDGKTREFVDSWIPLAVDHRGGVRHSQIARDMIRDREWQLKHNRARLHNARALERWTGQSGAFQANYRWNRVRAIVGDIRRGLGQKP